MCSRWYADSLPNLEVVGINTRVKPHDPVHSGVVTDGQLVEAVALPDSIDGAGTLHSAFDFKCRCRNADLLTYTQVVWINARICPQNRIYRNVESLRKAEQVSPALMV